MVVRATVNSDVADSEGKLDELKHGLMVHVPLDFELVICASDVIKDATIDCNSCSLTSNQLIETRWGVLVTLIC